MDVFQANPLSYRNSRYLEGLALPVLSNTLNEHYEKRIFKIRLKDTIGASIPCVSVAGALYPVSPDGSKGKKKIDQAAIVGIKVGYESNRLLRQPIYLQNSQQFRHPEIVGGRVQIAGRIEVCEAIILEPDLMLMILAEDPTPFQLGGTVPPWDRELTLPPLPEQPFTI